MGELSSGISQPRCASMFVQHFIVLVCTVAAASAKSHAAPRPYNLQRLLNKENEVKATELKSVDEVDAQLIKELQEVLSKKEVENIDEVTSIQEVVNKQPLSKVTPLKSVQEVNVQEVISKVEVPEETAKKFLDWLEKSRYAPEIEEGPTTKLDDINDEIDSIDKELNKKLDEIKSLEEVVSKLEIKKMEEVKKLQELRSVEEVKRIEEIKKLEEIINKEEVKSIEEVVKQEEVVKKTPVINLEELVRVEELNDEEVNKLKEMMEASNDYSSLRK